GSNATRCVAGVRMVNLCLFEHDYLIFFDGVAATAGLYTLSLHDALPIWLVNAQRVHQMLLCAPLEVKCPRHAEDTSLPRARKEASDARAARSPARSEERRVGKECRARLSPQLHRKK